MSKSYLVRTEPRSTSSSLAPGLAARIYDPAWMLGRQWQLGELLGDDAGSAATVDLAAETASLAQLSAAGGAVSVPYVPSAFPLDALVGGDPVRTSPVWCARLRIDTGREFLRQLSDVGLDRHAPAFRQRFSLDAAAADVRLRDAAGARLLDVASARVPDGQKIYAALAEAVRTGAAMQGLPPIPAQDLDKVRQAATSWLAWCDASMAESALSSWMPGRLAHGFSVSTGSGAGATVLDVDGFHGDALDWHAFDARPNAQRSGFKALPPVQTLPAGVRFRGMPNARWWEFEDASVDLGNVDAGPSDVARLALLEFALTYGNDFFSVPLRLPIGSLCRIASLVIGDTFGMRLRISAAGHGHVRQGASRWTLFGLSERSPSATGTSGVSDLFFLPPVANQIISGAPVEEVMLLRDEMANLAWAVERRYEGEAGIPVERAEEPAAAAVDHGASGADSPLRYTLGTAVPPYWFPLLPYRIAGELQLQPASMANAAASAQPRGRLFAIGASSIPDREVPREGRRLLRDYALTRWSNGGTFVWARRICRIGRGEGSSGLRFDVAAHGPR